MRLSAFILAAAVLFALPQAASPQNRRGGKPSGKPPDVLVVDFRIHRDGANIALEGKLKSNSAKPLKGLVLFIEFLEFNGRTISRMNHRVSEAPMEAGEEGGFLAQTPDMARAVKVKLDAEDLEGRYLAMDKPGPYVID